MKNLSFLPLIAALCCWLASGPVTAHPTAERPTYFELKVYHLKNARQEARVDSFLQQQYLPTMRAAGIAPIGVFKPIGNDTAADRRIYVFTPFTSLKQWEQVGKATVPKLLAAGGSYENAAYTNPAYTRLETLFIKAFDEMAGLTAPALTAPKSERVYELRSYEGASEKIFRNKVQMFNAGGEIKLFSRLNFNAIFYGEVLFGPKMPNLMYMTSFANMPDREAHWKAFGADPEWKKLSSLPEYQNNVSHMDITFLRPAAYSGL
ncbi:NIPSNAP family protein [Hymenobacter sp. H14-R3]|uniref:NIPSNAP family protein n=1 Tax=Hymenobacter sp. H14-R3 TaxID=3046308 RepID=UPI0024B97E15|nr:NIPSNAP family protein [Hymenobacter sp. H14-R3]MDJ0365926.1 NIPSNAP family protein [Hymenobacter sp. H14-R3]